MSETMNSQSGQGGKLPLGSIQNELRGFAGHDSGEFGKVLERSGPVLLSTHRHKGGQTIRA